MKDNDSLVVFLFALLVIGLDLTALQLLEAAVFTALACLLYWAIGKLLDRLAGKSSRLPSHAESD